MKWKSGYENVDGKQRKKERTVVSKDYDIKGIKWNLFIYQSHILKREIVERTRHKRNKWMKNMCMTVWDRF